MHNQPSAYCIYPTRFELEKDKDCRLMQFIDINVSDLPYFSRVTKTSQKCENLLLKRWFFKLLITDFSANLKNVSELIKIENVLFVIHLESDRLVMNISRGLEFLHIDLWSISSDLECLVERSEL
ncbi:hypothetical protein Tco_1577887 [Tanacetum coccineum]